MDRRKEAFAIFTSSVITELIGIHAIFGAFLCGTVIPRQHEIPRRIASKLEDLVGDLFALAVHDERLVRRAGRVVHAIRFVLLGHDLIRGVLRAIGASATLCGAATIGAAGATWLLSLRSVRALER